MLDSPLNKLCWVYVFFSSLFPLLKRSGLNGCLCHVCCVGGTKERGGKRRYRNFLAARYKEILKTMVLHLMAHARACSYCSPLPRVVRPFFPLARRFVKNLPSISAWISRNISIVRSLTGGNTQTKDYFSLSG